MTSFFSCQEHTLLSTNSVNGSEGDNLAICIEYFNQLNFVGLPLHILKIEGLNAGNTLSNLNQAGELFNGMRLIVDLIMKGLLFQV